MGQTAPIKGKRGCEPGLLTLLGVSTRSCLVDRNADDRVRTLLVHVQRRGNGPGESRQGSHVELGFNRAVPGIL